MIIVTHNPLIIALDTSSSLTALYLVRKLKVTGVAFKVGFELFLSSGRRIVERILAHDVRVFLDLKFHDIPHTVARAAAVAAKMGIWMFNVHASGGGDMLRAAKDASLEIADKKRIPPPLVVGVTVLTSLSSLKEMNIRLPVEKQVVSLARLCQKAGLDGVVASAREASVVRKACGRRFTLVTPGIRLPSDPADDQKRTMSPSEAVKKGANYLVIGRPVIESPRPLKMVAQILTSLPKK